MLRLGFWNARANPISVEPRMKGEGSMEAKRIEYIDTAKGIAMLCIVAGHLGVDSVNRIVFSFHVPIFFIISGYFLHDKDGFIRKRAIQLLKPYLFTSLVLCFCDIFKTLIKVLIGHANIGDVFSCLENWGGQCYMALGRELIF